ncbi:MAG TPA: metallophosphoesterase [Streptosporangiaceae bacterium]|jgi:Icc-related predicted phosphoesterase|nr:metallophosphoesterase [Streptosporangiaceae bacterium]
MRVHVVSDVHGRADALATAARGADALICLGDLLLFLDYADHSQGIFASLFGADHARAYIELRNARRFDEARALSRRLFAAMAPRGDRAGPSPRGAEGREAVFETAIKQQYRALFAAMPEPAYLTYGNVDVPALWPQYLKPGHRVLDGEAVELDGWRFGFAGGGLISPYRTPYEMTEDAFRAKLEALGEVDVLCTHIPPAVPELLYDTVARRMEKGSVALLEVIRRTRPRYAIFGHVHQPLARRTRVGVTECLNVGHFRASGVPYGLQW